MPFTLLSLLFAPGGRPVADQVEELGRRTGAFAVSHRPAEGEGWLELLVNGLTFDVRGLGPAAEADPFVFVHRYALPNTCDPAALDAVTLSPGAHLAGAEAMMPVVRAAAGLAAALTGLAGCEAVGWRPARTVAGAAHFRNAVDAWLGGGAFPALGLTALTRAESGSLRSEGLDFLIGREFVLRPSGASPADDAKLAIRLIDLLVQRRMGEGATTMQAMPGVTVLITDDHEQRIVCAERVEEAERATR
ncbi:MAG: hypothetical protein ABW194_04610 [Novosphingobium sp.]